MADKIWYVYLLRNKDNRTYIGSTTDVNRRLRQHNKEIKGGARATSNHGPWLIHCYLSGFQDRSSACRWEKLLKMRSRGLQGRASNFYLVSLGICPEYKSNKQYDVPTDLTFIRKVYV